MLYDIPTVFPTAGELVRFLLAALGPEAPGKTAGLKACQRVCREFTQARGGGADTAQALVRHLDGLRRSLHQTPGDGEAPESPDSSWCEPLLDERSGALPAILSGQAETIEDADAFRIALCFGHALLRDPEPEAMAILLSRLLASAGIRDLDDNTRQVLRQGGRSPDALPGGDTDAGQALDHKNSLVLLSALYLSLGACGRVGTPEFAERVTALHRLVAETYQDEARAFADKERADRLLYDSVRFIEPRSIEMGGKRATPQQLFVMPRFGRNGAEAPPPTDGLPGSAKSCRRLIVAKTGLGKSMYLQTLACCHLARRYSPDALPGMGSAGQAAMALPEDLTLLFIPARMFSFCYSHQGGRFREWTRDLVDLYYLSMWHLSQGYNFFSASQRLPDKELEDSGVHHRVSEALRDYLRDLALRGKLLILLDSFDEIALGPMRDDYLKALARLYDELCCQPLTGEVGAHVLMTSREMSAKTMDSLRRSLCVDDPDSLYTIFPLNADQIALLVRQWHRFLQKSAGETDALMDQVRNNHFYRDYAVNPYMLSVVCRYFGNDWGRITQKFITTLVERLLRNNRQTDAETYVVLGNTVEILQTVAAGTVVEGSPRFSRQRLAQQFSRFLEKTDLADHDILERIDRLHEIFVTEVGLIVPADGDDSEYQFVNDRIRYEMAVKGIQSVMQADEKDGVYTRLLRDISLPAEYTGLIVPLVCDINMDDIRVAELLAIDLALRDFQTPEEGLIYLEAVVDLVTKRYGDSIATVERAGKARFHVLRAQRMLMLRLLSFPADSLTPREKDDIVNSPAWRACREWLRADWLALTPGPAGGGAAT